MARSRLVETLIARLDQTYRGAASPADAVPMAAYMRDQFPFLGIKTPARRALDRTITAGLGVPSEHDLAAITRTCWRLQEREFQYFACDYLRRYVDCASSALLPTVETLITTKSWWDTVDALAVHVVGALVADGPELVAEMDRWDRSDNFWLVRSALLHQLRARTTTDVDRLFRYCTDHAADTEFFVRKAIGWALREYSRTDPAAVRRFVAEHDRELSGLSRREAVRHLR